MASSLRIPAGIATRGSFCRVYKQGQRRMGSKPNMLRVTISIAPFLVFLLSISTFSSSFAVSMADREVAIEGGEPSKAEVHIVYTEKPEADEPEVFHLRTLATVLGSEEAAKESLLYVYKNAATGFSAKLTPEQVAELSRQPGVLQVVPNMKLQLHSGPGRLH